MAWITWQAELMDAITRVGPGPITAFPPFVDAFVAYRMGLTPAQAALAYLGKDQKTFNQMLAAAGMESRENRGG